MRFLLLIATFAICASEVTAQCGGSFSKFVTGLKSEAISRGHNPSQTSRFFASVQQSKSVLNADRRQGAFQKPFIDFARNLISTGRLNTGRSKGQQFKSTFDRIEQKYGVNRNVLLAFWAFETGYGGFQGDFNTLNALVTLAHDCRRPQLFRPQIFAALELFERGDFDPARTTGAWAGEIGMVQMLPRDILENGVDGDGDGRVNLKRSAPDALTSGGKLLHSLGWRAGEPWLQEVTLPKTFNWAETGINTTKKARDWARLGVRPTHGKLAKNLQASIIIPQGRFGPAFIAYPNFHVYFEWNQSFTYVLTAAYFANRLQGAPVFTPGRPEQGLSTPADEGTPDKAYCAWV